MHTTAHLQSLLDRHRDGQYDALNSLLEHSHARLRELSDDVISARLDVPRGTLHKWALRGKWK